MSCHFESFISIFITSFQLTKNSDKQTASYSHVLCSKLPPGTCLALPGKLRRGKIHQW
jgi:hypothetical protein